MNVKTAIDLGELVLAFGRVERATFHEDGKRPETDTDHTVMLGLIATQLAAELLYNTGLVAEYTLVHDLVEAYVGDVNSFDISAADKAAKDVREGEALARIHKDFEDCTWLRHRITQYEEQVVPEARFVRYIDKIMPKITHALNGCAAIKGMGKSKADLVAVHTKQVRKLFLEYPEFNGTEVHDLLVGLMEESEDAY